MLFDRVCALLDDAAAARSPELKAIDRARRAQPGWVSQSGETVYTFYVDRFAGTLEGVIGKLDYLDGLGVRWLHPLPLLETRPGDSDGGFAVANYRAVEPALGDIATLERLAAEMRARGMGLMLDIVCNHTAREHDWAERARRGDPKYRAYYHVLGSEAVDAYSATLIDVFPDTAPGSFTYDAQMDGWVWTTFYPFQWDLNYANPDVFYEMLDVLLFLANKGAQGFRLDSAPFLWKRLGTTCRNQPEAYTIVAAFRAALDIAAPSVVLLTEAIENPADVIPFFGNDSTVGCDLAYNNGVMTALWAGLADQDAGIIRTMLTAAAKRPDRGAWLNYVRCHDDLIWNALADYASPDDLARWSAFYDGGGFSAGRRFQTAPGGVPSTNGMAASLVGLGRADVDQDLALARLRALYGVIFALDGWPMIYMGDEIALENDQDYTSDPARRDEGRWLQRPQMDWHRMDANEAGRTSAGEAHRALRGYAEAALKLNDLITPGPAEPLDLANDAVLGFVRGKGQVLLCACNLSPTVQSFQRPAKHDRTCRDVLSGRQFPAGAMSLEPHEIFWLVFD
ncbi:MAG: alpha-amylase [Sphingomonas sp.]|uniref:alpha-amylase family glycosyl hydrolase n=1 Tax=Sphingomonas sp. TaxID=28214 RepID=UPI001ACF406A|nr:alpha-amylase family glycosyl hydrolase [Sphingomonas sp.]MBN8816243.1 alpha-amylase [Sphingomonas sp.]